MDISSLLTDVFGHRGQEGDNVMLDHFFDLFNPIDGEAGLLFDLLQRIGRDLSQFMPGFTDSDLHVQPFLVSVLVGPDGSHFGKSVTANHRGYPRKWSSIITTTITRVNQY